MKLQLIISRRAAEKNMFILKRKKPGPADQVFHISARKTQPYVKYQQAGTMFTAIDNK
jgi:hypothetical protein